MTKLEKIRVGQGFVAALDQSGASRPRALADYGIAENRYGSEEKVFDLVHAMRACDQQPCLQSLRVPPVVWCALLTWAG